MSRTTENTSFICENCGHEVRPLINGSYRNHCPRCLHSKHLDEKPGDRASSCMGLMRPIGIKDHKRKGYQIIHKCIYCGEIKHNKIAEFDDEPDDYDMIIDLMRIS